MTYSNDEEMMYPIDCPVCGNKVDFYEICTVCGYQNSGFKEKIGDPMGPNKVTLKEAIENYKELGISDPNDDYCKILLNERNKND